MKRNVNLAAYPMLNTHRYRYVAQAVALACAQTALGCHNPYDFARWARQFRLHAAEAAPPHHVERWPL